MDFLAVSQSTRTSQQVGQAWDFEVDMPHCSRVATRRHVMQQEAMLDVCSASSVLDRLCRMTATADPVEIPVVRNGAAQTDS